MLLRSVCGGGRGRRRKGYTSKVTQNPNYRVHIARSPCSPPHIYPYPIITTSRQCRANENTRASRQSVIYIRVCVSRKCEFECLNLLFTNLVKIRNFLSAEMKEKRNRMWVRLFVAVIDFFFFCLKIYRRPNFWHYKMVSWKKYFAPKLANATDNGVFEFFIKKVG